MPTGKLVRLAGAEQWADRITTQLSKSVESIIATGRLLIQAKRALPHGEWGRMFKDGLVPFSQNTADRLMAIASHAVLSNSAHVQNLPASWGTLYELTKVEPKTLTAAIKDGVVTVDMPRARVKTLRSANPVRRPRQRVGRTPGSRLYFDIERLLLEQFAALDSEDREFVISRLEARIAELRTTAEASNE